MTAVYAATCMWLSGQIHSQNCQPYRLGLPQPNCARTQYGFNAKFEGLLHKKSTRLSDIPYNILHQTLVQNVAWQHIAAAAWPCSMHAYISLAIFCPTTKPAARAIDVGPSAPTCTERVPCRQHVHLDEQSCIARCCHALLVHGASSASHIQPTGTLHPTCAGTKQQPEECLSVVHGQLHCCVNNLTSRAVCRLVSVG